MDTSMPWPHIAVLAIVGFFGFLVLRAIFRILK
jgi:hypothetical protein